MPDHWQHISQNWNLVASPLRPASQDIVFYTDAIGQWCSTHHAAPRVLILGVTPELYHLPWPEGTDILAVDHTQAMIDAVWPGPPSTVLCSDWTTMPLRAASRDIVLWDGGVHLLTYPAAHRTLTETLHRVVAPNGVCIFRLYVQPDQRESPSAVLNDALAGRIRDVNVLKLRLCMALHDNVMDGVQLSKVWDALHQVADLRRLAEQIGLPPEPLLAINSYRSSLNRYHFLSLAEMREVFCRSPGGFTIQSIHVPTYELGERCPVVVLRRTGGSDEQ